MNFSKAGFFTVCALALIGATASGAGAEPGRSGWYVGGGIGVNWTDRIGQAGWNRDPTCYPDFCGRAAVPGYRWTYDLEMDAGTAFEISVGRFFNRWRLEIAAAQRDNAIDQQSTGITYLDGKPLGQNSHDGLTSVSRAMIDALTTRTLSINGYYDFPDVFGRITPYLGVGVGVAFVEISDLYFSLAYSGTDPTNPARDPSFYNSTQDVDISDTVLLGNLYAGADYSLTDETLLGVKLTYSMMGDVEYTGRYAAHPLHDRDPAFTNRNTFSGLRQFSAMITVKYLFGD